MPTGPWPSPPAVTLIVMLWAAAQAGRLVGTSLPLPAVEQRLKSVRRLWIVDMSQRWENPPFSLRPDFRQALSWHHNQMWIRLYVRVRPSASP